MSFRVEMIEEELVNPAGRESRVWKFLARSSGSSSPRTPSDSPGTVTPSSGGCPLKYRIQHLYGTPDTGKY